MAEQDKYGLPAGQDLVDAFAEVKREYWQEERVAYDSDTHGLDNYSTKMALEAIKAMVIAKVAPPEVRPSTVTMYEPAAKQLAIALLAPRQRGQATYVQDYHRVVVSQAFAGSLIQLAIFPRGYNSTDLSNKPVGVML